MEYQRGSKPDQQLKGTEALVKREISYQKSTKDQERTEENGGWKEGAPEPEHRVYYLLALAEEGGVSLLLGEYLDEEGRVKGWQFGGKPIRTERIAGHKRIEVPPRRIFDKAVRIMEREQ